MKISLFPTKHPCTYLFYLIKLKVQSFRYCTGHVFSHFLSPFSFLVWMIALKLFLLISFSSLMVIISLEQGYFPAPWNTGVIAGQDVLGGDTYRFGGVFSEVFMVGIYLWLVRRCTSYWLERMRFFFSLTFCNPYFHMYCDRYTWSVDSSFDFLPHFCLSCFFSISFSSFRLRFTHFFFFPPFF